MNLTELSFALMASVVLFGAIIAVGMKNVFYNALGLGLSFFGVAGIFIFLGAEFIALMQVIIYIGAVSIAIIFAIMMSPPLWIPHSDSKGRSLRAFVLSLIVFGVLANLFRNMNWPVAQDLSQEFSTKTLGQLLLTDFILPFELISLVLLIAIIGALVISGRRHHS